MAWSRHWSLFDAVAKYVDVEHGVEVTDDHNGPRQADAQLGEILRGVSSPRNVRNPDRPSR